MTFSAALRCSLVITWFTASLLLPRPTCRAESPSPPLATVNKHSVVQRDVDLELLISGVRNPTAADREAALNRVIDRFLISSSIEPRRSDPLADDVEELVQFVRRGIESGGENVDAVLTRLNLTEADIRQAARLTINWNAHVLRTVSDKEIRQYFEQHRDQFDGTRVRVRQIVLTVPSDADATKWSAAQSQLNDLRSQIESGKLNFADAARQYSQSPSGKNGGDIGMIRYRGDVPAAVATAAFALKSGQVSEPVRSPIGFHLIEASERQPGDLSLEDARPAILRSLSDQLWQTTARQLRSKAKITY